jgi:acetaldehyde dehydrogenase (acetylating)
MSSICGKLPVAGYAEAALAVVWQKRSPGRESPVDAFCAAKQSALKGIGGSKEGKALCFGLVLTAFVI